MQFHLVHRRPADFLFLWQHLTAGFAGMLRQILVVKSGVLSVNGPIYKSRPGGGLLQYHKLNVLENYNSRIKQETRSLNFPISLI